MQWAILKIKEGFAYLSLDLIYDLKGQSQKIFRENVTLTEDFCAGICLIFFNSESADEVIKLKLILK
jgi:hypothetical protein